MLAFGPSRRGTGDKSLGSCKKVEGGDFKAFLFIFLFSFSYHLIPVAFGGYGICCAVQWADAAHRLSHILCNSLLFNSYEIGKVRRVVHCELCVNILGGSR